MNAQLEQLPGAVPMPEQKKPRMTAKRLNEELRLARIAAYDEGRSDGVDEGLMIAQRISHHSALIEFIGGAVVMLLVEHAVLKPVWHWLQPLIYK